MELKQLDTDAKIAALKDVKNMLQRSGQLEKVDQFKHRVSRKKASVEAMLKTAMQNQLDGVRVGLKQLESCLTDIRDIDTRVKDVDVILQGVPEIYDSLEQIRNENTKHSQYETAMENLKHIFTVQSSVKKAMQWIEEDKLLHAHQCLSDLENSRDDLLFELHKFTKQQTSDTITLKRYFEQVVTVSATLEKKIRLILQRTLDTVRTEPTVIVTALRIIEREEKSDQFALQQQKQTGFLPPGRPKKWRQMALDVFNNSVVQRIESSKADEREVNKLWLVRNLEILRQFILGDLRVVKSLCVPCFPPHYDIFNEYVKMFHTELSKYLDEIATTGLEGNEYVSVLSWIMNTYPGVDLMRHPDLNVDVSAIGPLIKPELLKQLESEYLKTMERNYEDWMTKTLQTEQQEWFNGSTPEADGAEQYYHTSAPVIIFQMIDQNLQVTNTIHSEITFQALVLSIQQVTKYGENYRLGIFEFRERHFKDRNQVPHFTQHMITIVNNCQQIMDLAQQIKQLYWPKTKATHYEDFDRLLKTYQNLREEVTTILLEEAFLDLEIHFNELFTMKWMSSTISMDTICVTLNDYFTDYKHLRPINFEHVINSAQRTVALRYIKAMLSKRLSKSKPECDVIMRKILKESGQMRAFFDKQAPQISRTDSPVDLIPKLADIIVCDFEMIVLDLHTLLGNYPSINEDHLVRLLYFRNDIKANEVREKYQDATKTRVSKVNIDKHDTIFKDIVFSDKLW